MSKILSALYLLYAALLFISLMFVALPLVLITTSVFNSIRGRRIALFFLRAWAWSFSILSFFWVKVSNVALIDRSKPHIYVANHGSYLDAVAICIAVPQPFSALGKVEMARVPVFGWIYSRMVVMIDRSSKTSRERSVETLTQEIKLGQSILIFPEGTMNKSPEPLADFYDGAFRIAIQTQTPIQPLVMLNNSTLLPRVDPLKAHPGFITCIFLPAISVQRYTMDDVERLKKDVHQTMLDTINAQRHAS